MMQRKKIVQINAYYGNGSTGNIVKSIDTEGRKRGFDMYSVYWLQPNEKDPQNVFFVGKKESSSIEKKYLEWILFGGKLSYNRELTEEIVETVKRIDPDIIHLHNLHGDFECGTLDFCILFDFLAKTHKQVIWTFHDCWPITGRCYHFQYKKCDKWKTGCGSCPQRVFDRQGIFYDFSAQNWIKKKKYYDAIDNMTIVTVSNWLNSVVKQSMLKKKRIITIYNGLKTDVFYPKEKARSESKYKILCIGWDRRKGYKDYFELSKYLAQDEEIIVVGKRPLLRRYKKLPTNIKEIDRAKTAQQMSEIYRSSDVYFNASQAETFGLTTAEAMSCGIPVIGYNTTATPEVIAMIGNGGLTVNAGDIKGVRSAIDKLRNSSFSVNEKDCKTKFKWQTMLNSYLKLYQGET